VKKVFKFMGRLTLLFSAWVGVRAAANPLNFRQELVYGKAGQQSLRLNFYAAKDGRGPAPLVARLAGWSKA